MMKKTNLIQVKGESNANKYYNMTQINDNEWVAEYGRVGYAPQRKTYLLKKWQSKYNEKLRDGYVDITPIKVVETAMVRKSIQDEKVNELLNRLAALSNKTFRDNYLTSASEITEKQISQAQDLLNELFHVYNTTHTHEYTVERHKELNQKLETLYTIIPRRMHKVSDYLLSDLTNPINLSDFRMLLSKEQDLLDNTSAVSNLSENTDDSLLESLDIEIVSEITDDEQQSVLRLVGNDYQRITNIFKLKKDSSNFDDWKSRWENTPSVLRFHGTRSVNVLSIFERSLLIRPSNAVHTGSMFGDGIYTADDFQKSLGYTSLSGSRWANGYDNHGYMFIFEVKGGKIKELGRNDPTFQRQPIGYDSIYAKAGHYGLRMNEFVVYNPSQVQMKYLLEIK